MEETTMNRKIAFTALSLAIVLGGASGAMASGKKHSGHEAYASAGGAVADPRLNKGAGNHESWCDLDEHCNGWAAWLQDVKDGKLKN
jgi:hypothetical protein